MKIDYRKVKELSKKVVMLSVNKKVYSSETATALYLKKECYIYLSLAKWYGMTKVYRNNEVREHYSLDRFCGFCFKYTTKKCASCPVSKVFGEECEDMYTYKIKDVYRILCEVVRGIKKP